MSSRRGHTLRAGVPSARHDAARGSAGFYRFVSTKGGSPVEAGPPVCTVLNCFLQPQKDVCRAPPR